MRRFVGITVLFALALLIAMPSMAMAVPPAARAGGVVRYTLSVSVDGGPFRQVRSGTNPGSMSVAANTVGIASVGSRSVTYRNTAWSLVQPLYYLDNRLSWSWSGSSCRLVSRGYTAAVYPGNGWSCFRLNYSSYGGTNTSHFWSKYQYTYKYNGSIGGIPIIFFKNLGLQVNGYAGGSSSASSF